jgi:AraC-like DNA-binding protein
MENLFRYFERQSGEPWGITVQTCGHQATLPNQSYPPPVHPSTHAFTWEKGRTLRDIHILYIVTGSGELETRQQRRHIVPGDVVLLYPNEWHRYRPKANTGWEEYWIGFKGPQVDQHLLPELFPEPVTTVKNIGYHDEVLYLFQQALSLSQRTTAGFQKILSGIVWQLVAYVANPGVKPRAGSASDYLVDVELEHIRLNLSRGVDFHMRAREAGISYSHFRKLIRDQTGLAPQQLLLRERLKFAGRLLQTTSLTITEIARLSGFQSAYYFSAYFKAKTGKTPSRYREMPVPTSVLVKD